MNKYIDFTQSEGLGVTQDTFDFMQSSYRSAIGALAAAFGNKVIISGVNDDNVNLTDGWVIIDGEVMPFVGGVKAANIITQQVVGVEEFADLSLKPVYYTKTARAPVIGGYPYAEFKRLETISDMLVKLNQIITDFNNYAPDWADIQNPPTIPTQKVARVTSVQVGDPTDRDAIIPVNFTTLGTTQYIVSGSLVSQGNAANDNECNWLVRNLRHDGFDLVIGDRSNVVTNLRFDYAIILK